MTAYLSAQDIRDRVPALADTSDFPDVVLKDLVEEFTDIAEDYLHVAFTSHSAVSSVVHLDQERWLELPHRNVTSVTSITIVNGTTTTTLVPTYLDLNQDQGVVDLRACYTGSATVVYVHGLPVADIPKGLLRACREYVRSCALTDSSNVPRDVISQSFDGMVTRYSTPDASKGRPTGWLEVDRLLNSLPQAKPIPGVG